MKETAILIDTVKVGDVLTFRGTGYQDNIIRNYTVTRITKTQIVCSLKGSIATYKIDRRGVLLPKDRFINHYVTHVNGVKYPNE